MCVNLACCLDTLEQDLVILQYYGIRIRHGICIRHGIRICHGIRIWIRIRIHPPKMSNIRIRSPKKNLAAETSSDLTFLYFFQTIHPTDLGLLPSWISIRGLSRQGFFWRTDTDI